MLESSINDAYQFALSIQDTELKLFIVIRLMGRTGVCPDQLKPDTLNGVLEWCVAVLNQREFIDVLLPWLSKIISVTNRQQMELNQLSTVVELLLQLLEEFEGRRGLDSKQRQEVLAIY